MERNQVLGVAILALVLLAGGYIYITANSYSPAATYPQANLDFEHHPETETVTVSHRKGETIDRQDAKALEVYVFPVDESRPSEPRTTIALPFGKGDTATIHNVTDNDSVVVILRGESGSHVMGKYPLRDGENG